MGVRGGPQVREKPLARLLHWLWGMSQDLWNRSRPHPDGYREADPQQVAAGRGGARLIDVREPFELAAGRVPGAELVPLGQIAQASAAWSKDDLYVLVCRSGARSGRAAAHLASRGFSRVINMTGGMLAYAGLGLELERPSEAQGLESGTLGAQ